MAETTRNIEQAVINLGKECVVQITGDPDDEHDIKDAEQALGAIRGALEMGIRSHDRLVKLESRAGWTSASKPPEAEGPVLALMKVRESGPFIPRLAECKAGFWFEAGSTNRLEGTVHWWTSLPEFPLGG